MRRARKERAKKSARKKLVESGRANGKRAVTDITLRISPVMLVMATVFVAFGMAYEFACSLTAVVLHEFAHAKVAKRFGYALNEIKLMPYGAALCGSADMYPKHEALIAAAGPAFNFVIALIFAAMWWLVPSSYLFTKTFCVCNIYIGVFNLLPVYPMDGGRMLLAALSVKFDRRRAYAACRIVSAVIALAAIAMFALSSVYALNFCFLAVGSFMLVSAFVPDARAKYYALFAMSGRRERMRRALEKRVYAVQAETSTAELCRFLDPDRFTQFDVYDGDTMIASLSEPQVTELIMRYGYEHSVGELVKYGQISKDY